MSHKGRKENSLMGNDEQPLSILFIGNSYTMYNQLPRQLELCRP